MCGGFAASGQLLRTERLPYQRFGEAVGLAGSTPILLVNDEPFFSLKWQATASAAGTARA